MKIAYLLITTYPYEFSIVSGVFALEWDAEMAKTQLIMEDESFGYNKFDIEPHKVL